MRIIRDISVIIVLLSMVVTLIILYRTNKKEKFIHDLRTPYELKCSINQVAADEGLSFFKSKKLLICTLVRDSEDSIPLARSKAELLGSLFADYSIIIIENDSLDGTRPQLINWANSNPRIWILGCGMNKWECKEAMRPTIIHDRAIKRIEKMVNLRNIYLDFVKANPKFYEFDYVAVWDIDIIGTFYIDGIGTSGYYFKNGVNGNIPDAICANTVVHIDINNKEPITSGTYYDPYAHNELNDSIIFHTIEDIKPYDCNIPNLIHLKSCFNGFTIYRFDSFINNKYILKQSGKDALCEHVTFHEHMSGVYLNPQMIFAIDDGKNRNKDIYW